MSLDERARLEKLLGMLGSSFDGERSNAARLIASMAEKRRVTIVELIYGDKRRTTPPPPVQEPPRGSTIIAELKTIARRADEFEFTLTAWECQFAADVSARYSRDYELSAKQLTVAQKIIEKVRTAYRDGAA